MRLVVVQAVSDPFAGDATNQECQVNSGEIGAVVFARDLVVVKSMLDFSSKPSGSAAVCFFVCAKWQLCFVPGHFAML